jgi:hypothetical protein
VRLLGGYHSLGLFLLAGVEIAEDLKFCEMQIHSLK